MKLQHEAVLALQVRTFMMFHLPPPFTHPLPDLSEFCLAPFKGLNSSLSYPLGIARFSIFGKLALQRKSPQKCHVILQDSPGKPDEQQKPMAFQVNVWTPFRTFLKPIFGNQILTMYDGLPPWVNSWLCPKTLKKKRKYDQCCFRWGRWRKCINTAVLLTAPPPPALYILGAVDELLLCLFVLLCFSILFSLVLIFCRVFWCFSFCFIPCSAFFWCLLFCFVSDCLLFLLFFWF